MNECIKFGGEEYKLHKHDLVPLYIRKSDNRIGWFLNRTFIPVVSKDEKEQERGEKDKKEDD